MTTITTTCEVANGVRYYDVHGAKHITLAKMRDETYEKGDIFNVYTATESKYGCEYDGLSVESSIERFEAEHKTLFRGKRSPAPDLTPKNKHVQFNINGQDVYIKKFEYGISDCHHCCFCTTYPYCDAIPENNSRPCANVGVRVGYSVIFVKEQ